MMSFKVVCFVLLPISKGVKPKSKHFQERFGDTARYLYEEPTAMSMITRYLLLKRLLSRPF